MIHRTPRMSAANMESPQVSFLSGGGEMGALMRSFDWSQTSMGLPHTWPQSLRTALSIVLHSGFPMFIFWGEELTCFYNDAYRPSLGNNGKHPSALGAPAAEVWTEIWDVIKPLIDRVLQHKVCTWSEDQLIPIYRNGQLEDVYWTFSYSPLPGDDGETAGVLVTCMETTEKVVNNNLLQESRDQLHFAVEAAELGTWDYDPATGRFTANARLMDWFGLPHAERIELSAALATIDSKDRNRITAAIQRAMQYESGGIYDVTYTIVNANTGEERIVKARGKAWFDEHKTAYRLNGTLQDITADVIGAHKLGESERNFRNLVFGAPVGITVFRGPDFIVEMANETYLQIVDRSEQEFVGRPLFDSLPEVKDAVQSILTGVLTTGVPYYGYEFPVTLNRYGNAAATWFNFVYQPLKTEDGAISGVIVVANEVTESVLAKHRLAESEREFRNMVTQSPIPMTIFRGRDHVIEMANTIMFEKIWRRKPEEVIGKKALEVFPELNGQKYPELLQHVYNSAQPHTEKESLALVRGDDGLKIFYLDFEYAPLFDTTGEVYAIMITVNDVTERVEARKRIELAEERARLATNAAELGVFEVDLVTDEIICNERFREIFGVQDPVVRQELVARFHPDDLGLRRKGLDRLYADGHMDYEARLLVAGHLRWIRSRGVLYTDSSGSPQRAVGVIQDITEQKQSVTILENKVQERTEDLRRTNQQLERSNEDLQQFAHVASHDLKEPVRKIKTFSHRLQDDYASALDERGNMFLEKILHAANRMSSMIDGVLKYSAVTAADQPMKPVDLNEVIGFIISDLEVLIAEKQAKIIYSDLPVVDGYQDLIYQLLYNLVNNSLKFARAQEPAMITLTSDITRLDELPFHRIVLADNGIGFDNDYAERIFTTFTRLHSKDHYEGTGLGLALCKKIVGRHGGFINAKGQKNNGAVFTILLPATK